MVGKYSSIGICIKPDSSGGWWMRSPFQDAGFCDDNSTEGEVVLRYLCKNLAAGLDTIIADVESLGIKWATIGTTPTIYVHQDGEDPKCNYPADWREQVAAQCKRLGWFDCYRNEAAQ